MRILLRDISIEHLLDDVYVARMQDSDNPFIEDVIEAVFMLTYDDKAFIERVDESIDGGIITWDDSRKKEMAYIASRIEKYLQKHAGAALPLSA